MADGQDGLGRHDVGHGLMMPDRRRAATRARAAAGAGRLSSLPIRATTRGRPARSGSTVHVQPGRTRPRRARRSPAPWSAPISSSATPSGGERLRQPVEQPADDARARPARRRGRDAARTTSRPAAWRSRRVRTYGRLASTRSNGPRRPVRQQVRLARSAIRSATAWPTAFSRASSSASGEMSVARIVDRLERPALPQRDGQRDGDRAAARPDVDDPERRRARRPRGRRPAGASTSASASSTRRSVSGRGMSARASTSKARP